MDIESAEEERTVSSESEDGYMKKRARIEALGKFCDMLFNDVHTLPSGLSDPEVRNVDFEFAQDSTGVSIEFKVSWHTIGKLRGNEASEAIHKLLHSSTSS